MGGTGSGFQIGVALSEEGDTRTAARAAAGAALERSGARRAAWALCFFSAHHLQGAEVLRAGVLAETGCQTLAGCSAAGVIAEGREVQTGPAVAVMVGGGEGIQARSSLFAGDPAGLGQQALLPVSPGGEALLLALPDSYGVDAAALVARLAQGWPALPLFGAGASDNGTVGASLQMDGAAVVSGATALLAFQGDFDVAVGITQSCTPVGQPRFVTAASENVLLGLDGRPALEVYLEAGAQLGLQEPAAVAREVLFGFPLHPEHPRFSGETCLVRGLAGVDVPRQGLVVPFAAQSRTAVVFMQRNPLRAEEDMRRMVADLAGGLAGAPEFGIYFNCAARGTGLYGKSGVDAALIAQQFGSLPVIGMFGGFELATALGVPNVYTYTGVLLLFRARAAPDFAPPAKMW